MARGGDKNCDTPPEMSTPVFLKMPQSCARWNHLLIALRSTGWVPALEQNMYGPADCSWAGLAGACEVVYTGSTDSRDVRNIRGDRLVNAGCCSWGTQHFLFGHNLRRRTQASARPGRRPPSLQSPGDTRDTPFSPELCRRAYRPRTDSIRPHPHG